MGSLLCFLIISISWSTRILISSAISFKISLEGISLSRILRCLQRLHLRAEVYLNMASNCFTALVTFGVVSWFLVTCKKQDMTIDKLQISPDLPVKQIFEDIWNSFFVEVVVLLFVWLHPDNRDVQVKFSSDGQIIKFQVKDDGHLTPDT